MPLRLFSRYRLPHFEPDFEPAGFWLMRPVWYRIANSHVFCGDTGVGKTTLLYHGLHELAECDIYDRADLECLARPRKTQMISRFSLEQSGVLGRVDSWIDLDGERFTRAFARKGRQIAQERAFEKILDRVNVIVMVLAAQQLLKFARIDRLASAQAGRMADAFVAGFTERLNQLQPNWRRKLKRGGFKWMLVVSQSADVLKPRGKPDELADSLRLFARRTGFAKVCKRGFLCDSIPSAAKAIKVKIACLGQGPRGGLLVCGDGAPQVCSAGVVLAATLNRLRLTNSDHKFIIPLKS